MKKILPVLSLGFMLVLNLTGIFMTGTWVAVIFLGVAVFAAGLRAWLLFHSSIFFLLLSLSRFISPPLVYQFPALLLWYIFIISTLPMLLFNATRKTLLWLKFGKIDHVAHAGLIVTSISAAVALLLWASWTDKFGLATEMVAGLKAYPRWFIFVIGIPVFALLNALVEELIYRGLLQAMLDRILNARLPVIFLQATAFSAMHFMSGFPNGVVGYLMVLVYGMMLGYLRYRSGGLLVPVLTHILADLTIFYFMVSNFYK
jgi:membrane protease YdiL (CAAX protease family)